MSTALVYSDLNLSLTWTLTAVPQDGSPEHQIASGTNTVLNGCLGTFDPTLLANGTYQLRLTATDEVGQTSEIDHSIQVNGNLKMGNVQMSFTDLSIPVAGIPITVTRTYDSLDAGNQDDFGYGWHLGLEAVQMKVDEYQDSPGTSLFQDDQGNDYAEGTKVYVTM